MESTIADMMKPEWWTITRMVIAGIWGLVFLYMARDFWRE